MAQTPARPDPTSVLAHCELFSSLQQDDWAWIAAHSKVRKLRAGRQLFAEGETGKEMYVLVSGVLEAFKRAAGEEVILKRLELPGAHVGEGALLAGGVRRASIRCLQDSQVIAVPQAILQQAMQRSPAIEEHITNAHAHQLKQLSLVEQSVMYRALVLFDQEHGWSREQHFSAGGRIFSQGDEATAVYVVRSGAVTISRLEEDGQQRLLARLHDGQTFGEQAVLEGRPRSASAFADSDVDLVILDRERFLQASANTPELHEYLGTLKRVYALGAGVATLFDGEFRGEPAVVTVVHLDDGREVIVNHVVNRAIYSAALELPGTDAVGQEVEEGAEEFSYRDDQRGILRTLAVHNERLVRCHVDGPWSELSQVHALLLAQTVLQPEALQLFCDSGHLLEPAPARLASDPQAVLCQCLGLTRLNLESALTHGAQTLEELTRETGATTVCGGCTATIASMVESTDQDVVLSAEIDVMPGVRSYRFRPSAEDDSGVLRTALPGQHVVISANIDGARVHRPYTITSSAHCVEWREITVKLEDHGLFSSWLFKQPQQPQLKLSHPKGDCWVDPELGETVVCLVAGIGMTPALAIARSIAEPGSEQTLYIDYSARTEQEFAYRDELDALATAHPNIHLHYRRTGGRQHLDLPAVDELHRRFPQARYLICGPSGYQHTAQGLLARVGVSAVRVQVEVFTPVGHAPVVAGTRSALDQGLLVATLSLCALYLLVQALGWQPAGLVDWQHSVGYRIATGTLMLAMIAYQWYLPYLRLSNQRGRSVQHYRWHRYLGVLAPVLLYLHATSLGVAYTVVLGLLFVINAGVGAVDKTLLRDSKRQASYEAVWLLVHVPLSCLVTMLTLLHVFYALAYK